jgi:hypothetical protein
MDIVARCGYALAPLLNRSEARLLPVLEALVRAHGDGHRVMAQVSLGELLRPADGTPEDLRRAGHAAINSKRLDFAVIDRRGLLAAAIEYQGAGHYQPTAFQRDAVKREALRKAGIALIEVPETWTADDLRARLLPLIVPARPSLRERSG